MTARQTTNSYGNLTVKRCKINEGALTRKSNGISPTGGTETITYYANQVQKEVGELQLVRMDVTSTNKDWIVVEPATAGNDKDHIVGFIVSDPIGIDESTTSGQTPTVPNMREVSVAFLGLAIGELETGATSVPGHAIELSESETNVIGTTGALPTANGQAIFLKYAVDGEKVPVLFGYSGYLPAD